MTSVWLPLPKHRRGWKRPVAAEVPAEQQPEPALANTLFTFSFLFYLFSSVSSSIPQAHSEGLNPLFRARVGISSGLPLQPRFTNFPHHTPFQSFSFKKKKERKQERQRKAKRGQAHAPAGGPCSREPEKKRKSLHILSSNKASASRVGV